MDENRISRRDFIAGAAAAVPALGFPYIVSSSALGKAGTTSPANRIVMASIGLGIQGTGNMRAFLGFDDVQVVAVCDVRQSQRQKAKQIVDAHYGNSNCATYADFRQLLARPDIDAVCSAPPDHWHSLVGIEAARNRKDIYYEKPMGLSIKASKKLTQTVKKYNTVFQFGTQQRSSSNFRFGCELVRNRRIGKLRKIIVGAPPGITFPSQKTEPVEKGLDYDMWLGPAPWASYSYERCRPFTHRPGEPWYLNYSIWYHIADYCLGFIANWGIHHLDIARWGHGGGNIDPVEISGTGQFPSEGIATCATGWHVELDYADGVKLIYADAEKTRKRPEFTDHGRGVLFQGSDGWVFVCRDGYIDTKPRSLLKTTISPEEFRLPASSEHHRDFINAVKTRSDPVSDLGSSLHSDRLCHFCDIATRLRRKLRWDQSSEQFIDDPQANRMLARPMRNPWHL